MSALREAFGIPAILSLLPFYFWNIYEKKFNILAVALRKHILSHLFQRGPDALPDTYPLNSQKILSFKGDKLGLQTRFDVGIVDNMHTKCGVAGFDISRTNMFALALPLFKCSNKIC